MWKENKQGYESGEERKMTKCHEYPSSETRQGDEGFQVPTIPQAGLFHPGGSYLHLKISFPFVTLLK